MGTVYDPARHMNPSSPFPVIDDRLISRLFLLGPQRRDSDFVRMVAGCFYLLLHCPVHIPAHAPFPSLVVVARQNGF